MFLLLCHSHLSNNPAAGSSKELAISTRRNKCKLQNVVCEKKH